MKSDENTMGPGKNFWSDDTKNVWVDANGNLHLTIKKIGGKWYSTEIISQESFGYGEYTFFVSSNVETHNSNVVLGLFTYKNDQEEIDIEFSQWGNPNDVYGGYTVQPAPYTKENHKRFPLKLSGTHTTHKFNWQPDSIIFASYHGHFQNRPIEDFVIHDWKYNGKKIPKPGKERLHINLWLYSQDKDLKFANPPIDGQEVEVVIKAVTTPFAE